MKCNKVGCDEEATTKGRILVNGKGRGLKDRYVTVHACEGHKKEPVFVEEGPIVETKMNTEGQEYGGVCL